MRLEPYLATIVWLAALSVANSAGADSTAPAASDDVPRARELDQQGVRAFREGRYNDAIRYFEEALKLGAPSSELWNIARSNVKLDQPEAASSALERYLARTDLSPDDRASARRELDELSRRRSTVTIASSPTGAFVAIDGKRIGKTPTSADVPAGEHIVAVQREGYPPHLERVVARYGRAIIVDARLAGGASSDPSDEAGTSSGRHRVTGSALLAGLFTRLGSIGRPLHPAALVSLGYVAYEGPRVDVAAGVRLTITYDSWGNSVNAPALRCQLGGTETATALGAFADGAFGYRPMPRLRVGGDAGFGFATELGSPFGGDAFNPSCTSSPSPVPAGHVGVDVSYTFTPALRLVLAPLVFEISPAFEGARSTPLDASSAWIRLGAGLGLAVDL